LVLKIKILNNGLCEEFWAFLSLKTGFFVVKYMDKIKTKINGPFMG
jgi:hypothetical protein